MIIRWTIATQSHIMEGELSLESVYKPNATSNQSSFHYADYPPSRAETPSIDTRPSAPNLRTHTEVLQLFHTAVETSRAQAIKKNAESEAMESSISLILDLTNQDLAEVPEEAVDVMKKEHARYVTLPQACMLYEICGVVLSVSKLDNFTGGYWA